MEWRRSARRVRTIEHRDTGAITERCCDGRDRERPERHEFEQPGRLVLLAQLVDRVLGGTSGGAERDDGIRRVLQPVRLECAEPASGDELVVGRNLLENVESGLECGRL